jgi:RHS repeat-associated protein
MQQINHQKQSIMKNTIIIIMLLALWCNLLKAQQTDTPTTVNNLRLATSTPQSLTAQTTRNYIRTYTYRNGISPSDGLVYDVNIDVQYFDGLGRPMETVQVKASPAGSDVVALQTYDAYGRADKSYLPYASSTTGGVFVAESSVTSALPSFLSNNYELIGSDGSYGYSKPAYESSPLNRVLQQGAPGAEWQPGTYPTVHPDQFAYQTNSSQVPYHKYTGDTYNTSPLYYAIGSLYVNTATDGDGKQTRTYTDLQGNVVMKEAYDGTNLLQTKYCYDELGLLRCVMQPLATSPATSNYCFLYKYDARKRMTDKRVPGSDWEFMIYDSRDRLVLQSDGNSREASATDDKYYYTLYDDFNRPIEKGYMVTTATRATLVSYYASTTTKYTTGTTYYYTEKFYYDTHKVIYATCPFAAETGLVAATDTAASSKGLLTGKVTNTNYSTTYIATNTKTEAYYYDKYGKLLQTVSKNFAGGNERITNKYNFANQVVQTHHNHYVFSNTGILDTYYSYDHRGRLLNTEYAVDTYFNDLPRTIVSSNVYSEAGLLKTKYLHSASQTVAFMQKVDYKYNIRGWLTGINDPSALSTEGDKFGLKIGYNRLAVGTGNGFWNGNIAGTQWASPTYSSRGFQYSYDGNNRLTSTLYNVGGTTNGLYTSTYGYDKNGNISSILQLDGNGSPIDQITFGYVANSNRLNYAMDYYGAVADPYDFPGTTSTAQNFTYDYNGNVSRDNYRSVNITYNQFNLPEVMDFGNNDRMNYFYNSTGEKMLRAVSVGGGTPTMTYYFGPFVHEGIQYGACSLKYIITPEGRLLNSGSDGSPVWKWEYNLNDHLGNVRVVITPYTTAGYATVLQEDNYFPFGMKISQLSTSITTTNDYLYNGKQLQTNFNLNWYDYGARFYDPALGRWHSVDPMAEMYNSCSPYAYVLNNPVNLFDPNGMYSMFFNGEEVDGDAKRNLQSRMGLTDDTEAENTDGGTSMLDRANDFFKSIDPFSVPIGPGYDDERKKVEDNIKNTTKNVNYVSKYIVINGALYFLTDGIAYAVERYAGKILLRILGKEAVKAIEKVVAKEGMSVIGPRATYRQFAEEIGANYLKVTDKAWTWAKNEEFLAGVVKRGDDVIFAGKFNPTLLDKTSVLAKEINYLESRGYQWTSDFSRMIIKK